MLSLLVVLLGCGDGCPKDDLALYACPDGTCVEDLDTCNEQCPDGQSWCDADGGCVDDGTACTPLDTATQR